MTKVTLLKEQLENCLCRDHIKVASYLGNKISESKQRRDVSSEKKILDKAYFIVVKTDRRKKLNYHSKGKFQTHKNYPIYLANILSSFEDQH